MSVARADAAPDAAVKQDCGPGGCGPVPWMGAEDEQGLLGYSMLGLDRVTIDVVCTEQLMRTIIRRIIDDATKDRPKLSGKTGELTGVIDWLGDRNYFEAQKHALTYSRKYGGGGALCFIDDGRPPEMEVDILSVRGVRDFFALPKWYLTPADSGSTRVGRSWYGPRLGRPEHYSVSSPIGFSAEVARDAANRDGLDTDRIKSLIGTRFHRSRIIAWPYQDDLDLQQARRFANWNGWGPGVVEACLAPYLARRDGALRMTDIIRGSHFNVLTMPNVIHAQSTPTGGAGIRNAVAWVKYCLGLTGGGLPFTVVDVASKLEAVSHTLTGLSDVLGEQRRFLLDMLPEYTEVVLFSSGGSNGLSGDSNSGQWQAYYNNVDAFQTGTIWTAGSFGGGMQQAVRIGMMSKDGPTGGRMDMSCQPTWPSLWTESAKDTAETRVKNAEARSIDRVNLGLTPAALLRYDTTLAGSPSSTYPALDVDEALLPTLTPGGGALEPPTPGASGKAITQAGEALNAIASSDPAASPAPIQDAQVPLFEPVAPPPPSPGAEAAMSSAVAESLPPDVATETKLAASLGMTRKAFQKWVAAQGEDKIKTYPMPPGMKGGNRYRLGEVLEAFNSSAKSKFDAMPD